MDAIREFNPCIAEVLIGILIRPRRKLACGDIVRDIHVEQCSLPRMPAVRLLPTDLIVDPLLRPQIGCCLLSAVIRIHLGERRHDKGLRDVQIGAALRIELMQPLCRGAEVAVVLTACRPCRPRLAQTEYPRILCIKALLPLSEQSPVVACVPLVIRAGRCRQLRIDLTPEIHADDRRGSRMNLPRALHIDPIRRILFTRVIGFIWCGVVKRLREMSDTGII